MDVLEMVSHQQHIFDILKKNKLNQRLSHAYLFYGDAGVGKKEMAYALACLFYCPHDGCLTCDTCQSIIHGNHLNVNYIGIKENKKLISKEQILELQEEFSKTSLVDGYRIYIVDGIDTASDAAQNSLLKFIEEPTNQTPTIGIFIATDIANVVSTIVSRCALIHFPSIAHLDLIQLLIHQDIEPLDASLLCLITNNANEGKMLLEEETYQTAKRLFLSFLDIKNAKMATLYYIDNSQYFDNDIVQMMLKWLVGFYGDILKINDKECLILSPLYDKILLYSQNDSDMLKKKFSLILELYGKLQYNVVARNVMHELLAKLF